VVRLGALFSGRGSKSVASLPGISLVQATQVIGEGSIDEAAAVAPYVDAIVLDSGNPTLAIKELGGAGRVHD
jgi:phosphoribosylanthranilate isomerase